MEKETRRKINQEALDRACRFARLIDPDLFVDPVGAVQQSASDRVAVGKQPGQEA